jgi:Flp pilus assembly protein TadG
MAGWTTIRDRLARTIALARRFATDARGNIMIIFAITSVPIICFIGAAIDYSNASNIRTKLQAAQDAAVLSAVSQTGFKLSPARAQEDAIKFFKSQIESQDLFARINLTVTDTANGRVAKSDFSSDVTTSFMKIAGFPIMTVRNTSTATVSPPLYIDFYMLLDNSPSMGIGATQTDIDALTKLTLAKPWKILEEGKNGKPPRMENPVKACAFACHDLSGRENTYKIARNNNITLRIDVVAQATQQLTDTAQATATVANQFRMGVYTFGNGCDSQVLTTMSPLSSSLSSVKAAASRVDLMTTPDHEFNGDMCTDFDNLFVQLNPIVGRSGPGTAASPQKYVFFVTDGVAGAYAPYSCSRPTIGPVRCVEPLKPSNCDALKKQNVKIAVLYTTYLKLDDPFYRGYVLPFDPQISANMKACASPGFYFEVSPSEGISNAMNTLFKKAVATARLTQ